MLVVFAWTLQLHVWPWMHRYETHWFSLSSSCLSRIYSIWKVLFARIKLFLYNMQKGCQLVAVVFQEFLKNSLKLVFHTFPKIVWRLVWWTKHYPLKSPAVSPAKTSNVSRNNPRTSRNLIITLKKFPAFFLAKIFNTLRKKSALYDIGDIS